MSGDATLIEVERLSKTYGAMPALRSVSFSLRPGESIALLGPNGSGKTTLLRLLAGLTKPTAGSIHVGGWDMPGEAMMARAQIGLVGHQPLLYGSLTARENLDFFSQLYAIPNTARQQRIDDLLRQIGLSQRGDHLLRDFSRGMKQRLGIARALLHQPDILLLDEPFSGLDQSAAANLAHLIDVARAEAKTIILSTHQLWRLPGLAQRGLILSRGKLVWDGEISGMQIGDLTELYNRAGVGSSAA